MPPTPPVTVALAEIARLAGVGRAAVSNWRRRYGTFPAPVGGTDTTPQFDLAEVESWLRDNGKLRREEDLLRWLWPQFDALAGRAAAGEAIAAVAEAAGATEAAGKLGSAQLAAVDEALKVARSRGVGATYDFLLERWSRTHVRQISTTPSPLAELMVTLAAVLGDRPRVVLDPACGTGGLLLAAGHRWSPERALELMGSDISPVLARLAKGRIATSGLPGSVRTRIATTDTLRDNAWAAEPVDVVLCNPPYNARDWGHGELATDARWTFGLPPRTESELAWVQHALAGLADGGAAVLLLPPGVAKRRAGRRIRAGLLRTGALRAVIALPAGSAPPHAVGLHLWLLRKPLGGAPPPKTLLLVDAAEAEGGTGTKDGRDPVDWDALMHSLPAVVRAHEADGSRDASPVRSAAVPVVGLLDEQVDLTPARHVPAVRGSAARRARRSWEEFSSALSRLGEVSSALAALRELEESGVQPPTTSIDELLRAGAVELHGGQTLPRDAVHQGPRPRGAVPVLTVHDLLRHTEPTGWLGPHQVTAFEEHITLTAPLDVVVVGASQVFDAWVEQSAPTALVPQILALRSDPGLIDPWFLAGCLRSPGNARQAGSHSTHASRVDVRRLRVPRLPLAEQRRYGEAFRRIVELERMLRQATGLGRELTGALSDALAEGRLR
ncbi:N-6 DNA methylase [Streptomyces sp. NPDC094448]|uniref:N-6 DNA methylase n=1 Tax=Streptomyces sp. NPDC094448 TaxID=3366063 RepID=UPI00380E9BE9